MNIQEIAEFIVGNDLSYSDLVRLADQDGFATLMNPNVKKAQIILNEMGKIPGDPIDIFNQYKMSLDEYQRNRSFSTRQNIDFDFSGIPEDKPTPLASPIPTENRIERRGSFTAVISPNNEIIKVVDVEGDEVEVTEGIRNLFTPKSEPQQVSPPISSPPIPAENRIERRGSFTAVISPNNEIIKVMDVEGDEVEATDNMKNLFIPKPEPQQQIVEKAKVLAQSTRKKESNAQVLKSAMPQKEEVVQSPISSTSDLPIMGFPSVDSSFLEGRSMADFPDYRQPDLPKSEGMKISNPLREDQIRNARFDPTGGNPLFSAIQLQPTSIERYEDGPYTYEYENGVLVSIEKDGKVLVPENKITDQMRANAQKTYEKSTGKYDMRQDMSRSMSDYADIPQREEPLFDMLGYEETGLYDMRQDVNLGTIQDTLKKDRFSKLKQLGQKVKKGYQDLSKEQKAMGLLAGLDVAGEVASYFGPARREGRRRLSELEERRERGQLGVDERQDAETMKYMTRPVRAMAEESEREQQAVMAGMGETRSAADLRRLRESREAQMTDALSRAGQEVARQQMARKEMEKRELNQLQAYQQENLRNLTNRISGAAAQMAGTFGANVAAEADVQRELDPEMMERKIQILIDKGMDPAEARRKVQTQAIENARIFTGMRG